jgi:AcrR family transcriptional regulator
MTTGLRERKKAECRREISDTARALVAERGLAGVTVDEIAAKAGVSPRTFFNYFASKEEAVVGVDPAVIAEKAEDLRRRPADESPVEALRAVLAEWVDPERTMPSRRLRNEIVGRHPELVPRHLAVMAEIQAALAVALAERMGTDPSTDPRPDMLVAATFATTNAALAWWERSDRTRALASVFDEAFAVVAHVDEEPS